MRPIEIISGTPEEQAAQATVKSLSGKRIGKREELKLDNAKRLSRRLFTRRLVAGGITTAIVGIGGIALNREGEVDVKEETYLQYLSGFELVAQNDEEATELLRFFKERRKKGVFQNGAVVAKEPGDSKNNFYTAIIQSNTNLSSRGLPGFAAYEHRKEPSYLLLKDIKLSPVWAGALMTHEAKHIYQWLNGIEQSRPDGFMRGELEAYDTEFRVLDKATNGKLKVVLKEQSKAIPEGKYRAMLSDEDMRKISDLFNPPQSQEEWNLRIPSYVVALNFAMYETRSVSDEEVAKKKLEYVEGLYNGRTKLIGVNS